MDENFIWGGIIEKERPREIRFTLEFIITDIVFSSCIFTYHDLHILQNNTYIYCDDTYYDNIRYFRLYTVVSLNFLKMH